MSAHDPDLDSSPHRLAGRRWIALGVLSVAAALLHVAALGGLVSGRSSAAEPLPVRATTMQLRAVDLPAAPLADAAIVESRSPPVPAHDAVIVPAAAPAAPARARTVAHPAPAAKAAAPRSAGGAVAPTASASPAPLLAAATSVDTAPAATGTTDDEAVPHYRTRLPPGMTLRYELQHGLLTGTGDLAWRPQGDRYELTLDARVGGLPLLMQASSGSFDAAGVAPLRFTDRRLRRPATAANFQRAADKITYSGADGEFPLRAGTQDRLSWMVQLAAVVAAEPGLAEPGARILMHVTGSRGDLGLWVFRCIGPETVPARGASIAAIKFVREPRDAHDTAVQVWLDPQEHALPVRALQKSGPRDEGYELRLIEILPAG